MRRINRRAQRRFARIGDRSGRKASVVVCVVGRSEAQILAVEFTSVFSYERERISDCGIALQRLADSQTRPRRADVPRDAAFPVLPAKRVSPPPARSGAWRASAWGARQPTLV